MPLQLSRPSHWPAGTLARRAASPRSGRRVGAASGMLAGLSRPGKTQFDLFPIDLRVAVRAVAAGLRRLCRGCQGTRGFDSSSDTPGIALSEPALADDAELLRELGFDDHHFKPIRQVQGRAMLSRHLRAPARDESINSPANGRVEATCRPAGDARPGLDAAALGRLAELDPTGKNRLIERVLQAFQASVARLRPQLEAARGGGDRAAIRLVVHTLKSSSASIGAQRLSELCAQVETVIRLDTDEDLSAPLAAFSEALDSALQAIDALLKARA